MKIAYFDCFAGIAGDMIVGAFLDAGLPFDRLEQELKKLNLTGWQISAQKIKKHGITGTKFSVKVYHHHCRHHHHRNLQDIEDIIRHSDFDEPIKETALKIFQRLAIAEAKVHGTSINEIHFHEVGAEDSIIDIVAAAIGFHHLKIDKVMASPLTTGTGFVKCAHGTIPVPAPATVELLHGVPYRHGDIAEEMVTPTGAAVLTSLCSEYRTMPEIITQAVGYGAGDRELPIPNLLRVHIGEISHASQREQVWVIEASIDDMNPEFISAATEQLLASGALDVYVSQVLMKKGRPGLVIHVLTPGDIREQLGQILLQHTTTIGYRYYPVWRQVLHREKVSVNTAYGSVTVKVAMEGEKIMNIAPEYRQCLELAKTHKVPLKQVYNMALKEYYSKKTD
ncbi:nickel pincer cofactor biosynthesis protein LarC [Desulfofalx alkaliphila]|uniref:nickel pincer cofactor biosynthesis protein LarC n=1 Tax=Desulfofalx alkaliphila TaxID=105483 RepID=UPI0004E28B1A|nr:nickel pincer cofactor biosynthesis protein LarC [Desulfofalx alkaliphila]